MAASKTAEREALHRLADELDDSDVAVALRVLEALRLADDPVVRALRDAPLDDEPVSAEEEKAVAEARVEADGGELVPQEEIERELGIR